MYNITVDNMTYIFIPYPIYQEIPHYQESTLHHVAMVFVYIGVSISALLGLYNLYSLYNMKMTNKKSLIMGSISIFLSGIFLFYSIANNYLPFIITNTWNTFCSIASLGMQYYFYKHPRKPSNVIPSTKPVNLPANGLNEIQVQQVLNLIKLFTTLQGKVPEEEKPKEEPKVLPRIQSSFNVFKPVENPYSEFSDLEV